MPSSIDAILKLIEALWSARLTEQARRDIEAKLTPAIGNAREFAGLDILSDQARRKEIDDLACAAKKKRNRSPEFWLKDLRRPSDDTIIFLGYSPECWDNIDERRNIVEKAILYSEQESNKLKHDPSYTYARRSGRPRNLVKRDLGAEIYDLIIQLNETLLTSFDAHYSPKQMVPTCTPGGAYVRLMEECFRAAGLAPRNAKAIAAEIISQNDPSSCYHAELRYDHERERRRSIRRRRNSDK
jgi:hypothetical protein